MLAGHGASARAPQRFDELNRAKTAARVDILAPNLAAADRDVFTVDPSVPLAGQAKTVSMIAEQRFGDADAGRSQLVEEFELVGA